MYKWLDYQAPWKKKFTRASQALFLTKEIIKDNNGYIKIRNKFLCCRSDENKKANEQRNRYVNALEVLKRFIKAILALKALTEIKIWKIVKPLFSEKWMKKKGWKNSAGW